MLPIHPNQTCKFSVSYFTSKAKIKLNKLLYRGNYENILISKNINQSKKSIVDLQKTKQNTIDILNCASVTACVLGWKMPKHHIGVDCFDNDASECV